MEIPPQQVLNLLRSTLAFEASSRDANGQSGAVGNNLADDFPGFDDVTISVPRAIDLIRGEPGSDFRILELRLVRLGGRLVYEIGLAGGRYGLVDALSGERLTITREFAHEIAAAAAGADETDVMESTLLVERDFFYRGTLPAHRVRLDDERRTIVHVAARNGRTELSTARGRLRRFVVGFHTFDQVRLITHWEPVRKGILIAVSLVSAGAVITGFYLGLPALRRRLGRLASSGRREATDRR